MTPEELETGHEPVIDPDNPFARAAALLGAVVAAPEQEEEPLEDAAALLGAVVASPEAEDDEPQAPAAAPQETAVPDTAAPQTPAPVAPAPEAKAAAEASTAATVAPAAAAVAVAEPIEETLPPASPYDLPGSWYVVHSYSGYENKVKANLGTRIKSMHMEESIFDVAIPMEDVVEIKSGRKVTVPRKQFPGYILVRMYMTDDSWGVVRNTPGVTGFVGSGTNPTPLSRREVERILGVRNDEEKKAPRFKPDWEVGETVRVIDGPFADFNGVIEDINLDQSKVRVLVDIFGRETPVELNFDQIQKF